jgi:hypothetical protein
MMRVSGGSKEHNDILKHATHKIVWLHGRGREGSGLITKLKHNEHKTNTFERQDAHKLLYSQLGNRISSIDESELAGAVETNICPG